MEPGNSKFGRNGGYDKISLKSALHVHKERKQEGREQQISSGENFAKVLTFVEIL